MDTTTTTDRDDLTYWAGEDTSPLNTYDLDTNQVRAVYALANKAHYPNLTTEQVATERAKAFDRWLEQVKADARKA